MRILQAIGVGAGALALVFSGASAASAGEVTGKGTPTQAPANSHSLCSYSGLNDDQVEEPGRVQSYGQIVKAGAKAFAPSPSIGCNPTRGFEE